MFLVLVSIFPIQISNAITADEKGIIVDDTETDSSLEHYFTYSENMDQSGLKGWASDANAKTDESFEAKTQHWVWNSSYDEAKKHTYEFTFTGTGARLVGLKSDLKNSFQLDDNEVEVIKISGDKGKVVTLYEVKNLNYGKHKISVTLPEGNGLQVSYAEVYGAKMPTTVKEVITPDMQESEFNAFHYTAYEGKKWHANSNEAYIDLGTSDDKAEECYYEIPFVGNKIVITAAKSPNHGKVRFSIDGEHVQEVDLYAGTRKNEIVYSISGLTEEVHTLKAVTLNSRTGAKVVNQVVKAEIYHEPYVLEDISVEKEFSLIQGATKNIIVEGTPEYAPIDDLTFKSNNEEVATVDENGTVTALKEGKAVITVSASGVTSKEIVITVVPQIKGISGSIVDENLQYTQDTYDEVVNLGQVEKNVSAWQNDSAVSEIVVVAKDSSLNNVNVEVSDFKNSYACIDAKNITATFVKSVQAYSGMPGWGYQPDKYPVGNRKESSDVLYTTEPVNIPFRGVQPIWINIDVPEDTPAGMYQGTITVKTPDLQESLVFTYNLNVQNVKLPNATEFSNGFDIELWQYPYSSAEYYEVEPFSQEHLNILTSIMEKYKEVGGHAITTTINEDAWDRQTYSSNEIHYPSMVKWTKKANGQFEYDFTHFDKWVQFNKDLGIGDKIVIYSIAPWHNSFTYWENGVMKRERFTVGSTRYNQVWTDFFQAMVAHLDEKGWFDEAYVGIDERGLTKTALDLLDTIENKDGKTLKTAGAMDNIETGDHYELARRIDDLNVGDTIAQTKKAAFDKLVADRNELNLKTTLYSCTGHAPGNFSLSAPGENYWSMLFAYKSGTKGFLRWAYDAWVEDPLTDTTHSSFEAGDCFLIFPDHKDAKQPVSKSSIRLEKMAQGVRDVNKLMKMVEEYPELQNDVDVLLDNLKTTYQTSGYYLTDSGKKEIAKDMTNVHNGIEVITNKYLQLKGTAVDRSELESLLEKAKKIFDDEKLYTKESFDNFTKVYYQAVETIKNVSTLQEDLDTALDNLKAAINNLEKVAIEHVPGDNVDTGDDTNGLLLASLVVISGGIYWYLKKRRQA